MNNLTLPIPQVMQKAMAHHRQHQLQEALNLYAQVIEAEPRHFDALHLAGMLLVQDKHYEHALPLLDRAMALKPRHHELHHHRGNALHGLRRLKEALQSYVKCIEFKPDFALAYLGQSNVLADLQAHEQAVASIDSAIKLMPGYALLFFNRGNLMDNLGKNDEAIRSFDRAVALDPAYFEAWHNRGNLLGLCNRFTEAKDSFQHAVRLRPDHPDAHVNLAATYMFRGDDDQAMAEFARVVERFPDNANAHYIYSQNLLQAGLFERAWAEYAWRWQASAVEMRKPLATSQPRWTPASKPERLLIWAEQGVGDEIFWATQLRAAQQLAPKVIVQTDPRLVDLFSRALPAVRFVSSTEVVPEAEYDAHLPMGDLGQALQLNADKVSQMTGPFLHADGAQAQKIKAELCPPGFKLCGLSWKSTNKHIGEKKSMALQDLLPALKVPSVVFVNLQYGDVAQEIADLHAQHGIEVIQYGGVDNRQDLAGLANLIEACDLVLTTSNSTAHLAGALNKTTLNLVSQGAARIWYWRNEWQGRSLWYPSVKLLAPAENEQGWSGTVDRAAQHMADLLA